MANVRTNGLSQGKKKTRLSIYFGLGGVILHYFLPYYKILNGLCYRDLGKLSFWSCFRLKKKQINRESNLTLGLGNARELESLQNIVN